MNNIRLELIEEAWEDRSLLQNQEVRTQIFRTIEMLDTGQLRVAEPGSDGWVVNQWVKMAVILYFPIMKLEPSEAGPLEYCDKIPLKSNYPSLGVRVVPGAVARYGSFISPGVILMPSFVNIGSWIGENTMVDTWATVGSCAQIGKKVHLSGGVGIGGVLEPVQASPVIVGDNCFLGSRCVVVEGARLGNEAVLGANVVITGTTRILDVTGSSPEEYRGFIPPRSVVIPGTYPKKYPSGNYNIPCALIIGKRKESTDKKTSLNDALREYDVAF
jgi:2,3,4,5-tetrahydropyridine-2-carboxylate N-succinyltransferase